MRLKLSVVGAVFLTCILGSADVLAGESLEILLVAGQSNAVGFDALPKDLPPAPGDRDVMFWWRCGDPPPDEFDSTSGGQWSVLQPQAKTQPKPGKEPRQYGNFRSNDGGFGPEIGFARGWRTGRKDKVAVVKVAFSGTGLRKDWSPKDPGPAGSCYRALVAETRAAVKSAKEKGFSPHLQAVAWVQGESDATPTDAPLYEDALVEMMNALRKDLDAPDLAVLLAVNTRFGGEKKKDLMAKIVAAQQQAALKLGRSVYVDTEGTTKANDAHFDSAGTMEVGKRFADALRQLEQAK